MILVSRCRLFSLPLFLSLLGAMAYTTSGVHTISTSTFSALWSMGPDSRAVKCHCDRAEHDCFVWQLFFNVQVFQPVLEQNKDGNFCCLPTKYPIKGLIFCEALCKQKQFQIHTANILKPSPNSHVALWIKWLALPCIKLYTLVY